MKTVNSKEGPIQAPAIEREAEGCELNLSADRKWVRLVIGGKLIASFHVNYVNKVVDSAAVPIQMEGPRQAENTAIV